MIYNIKYFRRKLKKIYDKITFSSKKYWEKRYHTGGNSGSGSYNSIASFKAEVINDFINTHSIDTLVDLGCGDGNQVKYLKINNYIGLDVSKTAIKLCTKMYEKDSSKNFYIFEQLKYDQIIKDFEPELTLSLDVIYHLIENAVFETYIQNLFYGSTKFVIIFSTNFDEYTETIHHRNREFTNYVNKNILGWKLLKIIENPFKGVDSAADFYIYEKI